MKFSQFSSESAIEWKQFQNPGLQFYLSQTLRLEHIGGNWDGLFFNNDSFLACCGTTELVHTLNAQDIPSNGTCSYVEYFINRNNHINRQTASRYRPIFLYHPNIFFNGFLCFNRVFITRKTNYISNAHSDLKNYITSIELQVLFITNRELNEKRHTAAPLNSERT